MISSLRWERATRVLWAVAFLLAAVAMVLLGAGSLSASASARASARATSEALTSTREQVRVLRNQRDTQTDRAEAADARADTLTDQALAGIQSLSCAQYQASMLGSALAGLIVSAPTSTPEQRAAFGPFVDPPPVPPGC